MYYAHGSEELTSSKYPYYPKQFMFIAIPVKVPMTYFTNVEKHFRNLYGTINDPE